MCFKVISQIMYNYFTLNPQFFCSMNFLFKWNCSSSKIFLDVSLYWCWNGIKWMTLSQLFWSIIKDVFVSYCSNLLHVVLWFANSLWMFEIHFRQFLRKVKWNPMQWIIKVEWSCIPLVRLPSHVYLF